MNIDVRTPAAIASGILTATLALIAGFALVTDTVAQEPPGMVVSGHTNPGDRVWVINGSKLEETGLGPVIPYCDETHARNFDQPAGSVPNDGLWSYTVEPGGPCDWEPGDYAIFNGQVGDYNPVLVRFEPGLIVDVGWLPWSLGTPWPTVNVEPDPTPTPTVTPTATPTTSPTPTPTSSPTPTTTPTPTDTPTPSPTPTPEPTPTPSPSPTATPNPTPEPDVCHEAIYRNGVLEMGAEIACPPEEE